MSLTISYSACKIYCVFTCMWVCVLECEPACMCVPACLPACLCACCPGLVCGVQRVYLCLWAPGWRDSGGTAASHRTGCTSAPALTGRRQTPPRQREEKETSVEGVSSPAPPAVEEPSQDGWPVFLLCGGRSGDYRWPGEPWSARPMIKTRHWV